MAILTIAGLRVMDHMAFWPSAAPCLSHPWQYNKKPWFPPKPMASSSPSGTACALTGERSSSQCSRALEATKAGR